MSMRSFLTTTPVPSTSPPTTPAHPNLVPKPVPPPSTPTLNPLFQPPEENLFNVSYFATASHYWAFSDEAQWINDLAPKENFLSKALFTRFQEGSIDVTDPEIRNDFEMSPGSLFTPLSTMEGFIGVDHLEEGLFPQDTKSVRLLRYSSAKCFKLVPQLEKERPYLRACITNPEDCEYGLSVSIWTYFIETAIAGQQTLISTAPAGEAGFLLFIQNGKIFVKVSGKLHSWTCSAPVSMEKNVWSNFAFRWKSANGDISIYANNRLRGSCSGVRSMRVNGVVKDKAQSLWLGCLSDGVLPHHQTTIYNALLAHPAIWYWPLEYHVLFLGDKADRFEAAHTTTPTTPRPPNYKVDYTKLLEEYHLKNWSSIPTNPYYITADGYFELSSSQSGQQLGQDIELAGINCRDRHSFRLKTNNAYYRLKSAVEETCPSDFSACRSGFSIGAWVSVPSTLNAVDKPQSLFEVADIVKVTLYGNFLHIFVFDGAVWRITRLLEEVVRDEVFNVGFSISGLPEDMATGFINGLAVQTMAFASQKPNESAKHEKIQKGDLIIGSRNVNCSAEGVSLGDLVYWLRSTHMHEGHRFVGYTATQIRLLAEAEKHWSTDFYLLHDAPCRISYERKRKGIRDSTDAIANFKLASIYRPIGTQPVRYILDHEKKSLAPILSMRKNDYFMLGREKSASPTQTHLQWLNHCLHEPGEESCGIHGVTISVWLSLQSVSPSRIRYVFNSGDAGDSEIAAIMDGHGWAIFTHGTLLGASVSGGNDDWNLVLDPKTYRLNRWVNLGVTWSSSVGLKIFIDGIDLNMPSTRPKTRFKGQVAPPYLVVGRFDTDDSSAWLTPAEAEAESSSPSMSRSPVFWEMAHFGFAEMTYFNKYMTSHEYARTFGFLGNEMLQRSSRHLWFGLGLMDPSVSDLLLANQLGIPQHPGPCGIYDAKTYYVEYDATKRAVILGDMTLLRLGPLDPSQCPGSLEKCEKGFTVGGWYALIPDIDGMIHMNFTSPLVLLALNGGSVGIALTNGGHTINGWVNDVACYGPSTRLTLASQHNQWFHVTLAWFEGELQLYLNGNHLSTCTNTSRTQVIGEGIFKKTATHPAYLVIVAPTRHEIGYRLGVGVVNIEETYVDSPLRVDTFMGLSRIQKNYFAAATFYWPMSGILVDLAPGRIVTSSVKKMRDTKNVEREAICTKGISQSYIVLTGHYRPSGKYSNLYYSCLYDPPRCQGVLLIVDFRLNKELIMANREFTMLETPAEKGFMGLEITLNPIVGNLTVIYRSRKEKCSNSVNIATMSEAFDGWTNLQAFIYEQDLTIRINYKDITVGSRAQCEIKDSKPLSAKSGLLPKIVIGKETGVCISDVAIVEGLAQLKPEDSPLRDICYPGSEVILPLEGDQPDRLGRRGEATDLGAFTTRLKTKKLNNCFNKFMASCSDFTLSFWMLIKSLGSETASLKEYMVLSTGPDTYQGISISIQFSPVSKVYHLLLRLITQDSIYQIFISDFGESGTWYNIGVVVAGMEASGDTYAEVYRDGLPIMATSAPISRDNAKYYPVNPSPGVYFGSAITTIMNLSAAPIAHGTVNMFVFWFKRVASCGSPRLSHMTLIGDCLANDTLPETMACQAVPNCQLSRNGVCLDTSVENIYAMARSAQIISSPRALLDLLQVTDTVLRNGTDSEMKLLWSSIVLFDRLRVVEEADLFEIENLRPHADNILTFLLKFLDTLFSTRFAETWSMLRGSYVTQPPGLVHALAAISQCFLAVERPVIKTKYEGNYLASFSEIQDFSLWDGALSLKINSLASTEENVSITLTVSILNASTTALSMDVLSLPQEVEWIESEESSGDTKMAPKEVSAVINSPLLTISLTTNSSNKEGLQMTFEFTLSLVQPNEYYATAVARKYDVLHWKASRVEREGGGDMEYPVRCVLWNSSHNGAPRWVTNHCEVLEVNLTNVTCMCGETGSFAIAMKKVKNDKSFWRKAGARHMRSYKFVKITINLLGNTLSITALSVLVAYLCRKNTLRELVEHTKIKLNLAVALIGYHACFVVYPLLEGIEIGCRTIGVLQHIFSTSVLAWQCCNKFYLFNSLIYGRVKACLKPSIFFGWIMNVFIAGITACVTSADDYGTGLMCSPTGMSGYIAIGQTALLLLLSFIFDVILLCNIDAPAYLNPRVVDALQNDSKLATVSSVYSGAVYGLGLIFIWLNPPYEGFVFWTLNSLTGCLVAVLLGPLDKSNVVRKRKSSETTSVSNILGTPSCIFDKDKEDSIAFGESEDGWCQEDPPPYLEADIYPSASMEAMESID